MKEEDVKKKMCIEIFKAVVIAKSADSKISIEEIEKFATCKGSDCMMWEAEVVAEDIEIEVDVSVEDHKAWEAQAGYDFKFLRRSLSFAKKPSDKVVVLRRYVPSGSGDCGLKTKELYCEGCNQ